jgi:hypothetical protein
LPMLFMSLAATNSLSAQFVLGVVQAIRVPFYLEALSMDFTVALLLFTIAHIFYNEAFICSII